MPDLLRGLLLPSEEGSTVGHLPFAPFLAKGPEVRRGGRHWAGNGWPTPSLRVVLLLHLYKSLTSRHSSARGLRVRDVSGGAEHK